MHPPTVLVVDDDALVQMTVADCLEDSGFTVLEAGDAEEALAMLADHPEIGLLFTGINMPGDMDGWDWRAEP